MRWRRPRHVEQLQAVLHFVDGIVRVADADGVADAAGEQVAERDDASGSCPSPSARVGDAQVQRVVEALADGLVRVDDQQRVDRLGADDDVVEISAWKMSRYSSSLVIMMARKWPCLFRRRRRRVL
jgi:hypothetical protein